MLTRHAAVGGTGFVVSDDEGKVLITATLEAGETEGIFVALLLEYLTLRERPRLDADRPEDPDLPVVLSIRRPRVRETATPR